MHPGESYQDFLKWRGRELFSGHCLIIINEQLGTKEYIDNIITTNLKHLNVN